MGHPEIISDAKMKNLTFYNKNRTHIVTALDKQVNIDRFRAYWYCHVTAILQGYDRLKGDYILETSETTLYK